VKSQFFRAHGHYWRRKRVFRRTRKIRARTSLSLRSHGRCPELICHRSKSRARGEGRNGTIIALSSSPLCQNFYQLRSTKWERSVHYGYPEAARFSIKSSTARSADCRQKPKLALQSGVVRENMYFRLFPNRFSVWSMWLKT